MSEKSGASAPVKPHPAKSIKPPFSRSQQLVQDAPTLPALVRCPRPPHADLGSSESERTPYYSPRREQERFVHDELSVRSLDSIIDLLWLAGIPGNVRPLDRLRSLGRTIVPNEQMCFHLVWQDDVMFVKPLPLWLLHYDSTAELLWNPEHATLTQTSEELRRRAYRRAAALGFLMSYAKLITYESDLHLAQELRLVPSNINFLQWTNFAAAIIEAASSKEAQIEELAPRYTYGELRLPRLNIIYRLALRTFPSYMLTGYSPAAARTSTFISRNFYWVLTIFLWITVVLQALQVGLSSSPGQSHAGYQQATWVLSWVGIAVPAATLLLVTVVLVYVVVANCWAAFRGRVRVAPERMHRGGGVAA